MKHPSWMSVDLNLLKAFSVLVEARSVAAAARRMHVSESAMSRTLGRVRDVLGDPVLVRAGRVLVPTPRALELHARVRAMLDDAQAIIAPPGLPDLDTLERTFTVRCNEGFVAEYGAALVASVTGAAPRTQLRFVAQAHKDASALREERADIEIGVLGESGPEIRVQTLLRDRFVGVVAAAHPLACVRSVDVEAFVGYPHVVVSRRGVVDGPIDQALRVRGQTRRIAALVSSFPAALALARGGPFVACVPERQTRQGRDGMHTFALPVETAGVTVSMMWHPRVEHDAAHRWLREQIRAACESPPV
jgi:DNA-binding transcriptional LysR family regulator